MPLPSSIIVVYHEIHMSASLLSLIVFTLRAFRRHMTTGTSTTSITHIALTTNLHLHHHPLAIASSINLHRSIATQEACPHLVICNTKRIPITLTLTKVTIQEWKGRHHRQSAHRSRMPKKRVHRHQIGHPHRRSVPLLHQT